MIFFACFTEVHGQRFEDLGNVVTQTVHSPIVRSHGVYRVLDTDGGKVVITGIPPFSWATYVEIGGQLVLSTRFGAIDTACYLSGYSYSRNDTLILTGITRYSLLQVARGRPTELRLAPTGSAEWHVEADTFTSVLTGSETVRSNTTGLLYCTRPKGGMPVDGDGNYVICRYDPSFSTRKVGSMDLERTRSESGPSTISPFPDGSCIAGALSFASDASRAVVRIVAHDSNLVQLPGKLELSSFNDEAAYFVLSEEHPPSDTVEVMSFLFDRLTGHPFVRSSIVTGSLDHIASWDYWRTGDKGFFPKAIRRVGAVAIVAGERIKVEQDTINAEESGASFLVLDRSGRLLHAYDVLDEEGEDRLVSIQVTDSLLILGGSSTKRGPFWIELPLVVVGVNDVSTYSNNVQPSASHISRIELQQYIEHHPTSHYFISDINGRNFHVDPSTTHHLPTSPLLATVVDGERVHRFIVW